jgi:hypothetical protein
MSQQKKSQTIQQNKKELATQYRKEFFRKMKMIIDNKCGTDIYPAIPQWVLDNAYLCRSAPFKISADYQCKIPTKYLKDMKVILPKLLKKNTICLQPTNYEISIYDYFTVVFTIVIIGGSIDETSLNNADKVKEALFLFVADTATHEIANNYFCNILQTCNFERNDLRNTLYWFNYTQVIPKSHPAETENLLHIHSIIPETIHKDIDGCSRPVFRVGWTNALIGPDWISIKPSLLGSKSSFAQIPLKVYAQAHAINRLMERVDCFWMGITQYNLYCSLLNPKIAYNNNHNLLIEYSFFNTKVGYFRADIVDGIILLRTFLFVTNNGTPEGQLLEKNTGLQKLDKMYFQIDKLSTFMNSDLDKNTDVQRLFKNAGCQCLIDLYNNMKSLIYQKNNNFSFGVMMSYLNVNNCNTAQSDTESELQAIND